MADICPEIVKIIQGSKKRFTINLRQDDDPLDLTTNFEITVCLPGTTATQQLTLSGAEVSILSAATGKIQVDVPAVKSALLAVAEEQTIEVQIVAVSGQDPDILQIEEALTVIASIC